MMDDYALMHNALVHTRARLVFHRHSTNEVDYVLKRVALPSRRAVPVDEQADDMAGFPTAGFA